MRKLASLIAPALLALGLAAAPSAHAAVPVTLEVGAGVWAAAPIKCNVAVGQGASGLSVLAAAKQSGCIESYKIESYPGLGNYVACINNLCQQGEGLLTYWEMRENTHGTAFGIDGFRADANDVLTFTYTNFATFVVPGLPV